MSQVERVLAYMREHGSITQNEANYKLGCSRLSARIYDIRHKLKIPVSKVREVGKNRFGERTEYDRYSLRESVEKDG